MNTTSFDQLNKEEMLDLLKKQESEIKKLSGTLDKLSKEMEEVKESKNRFLSIISHDLKNPFASIVSFSRIIKRDFENLTKDEIGHLAEDLDNSVNRIYAILENTLILSRIESGKIQFQPVSIKLSESIEDSLIFMDPQAKEKDITLFYMMDKELSVNADPMMFDTIMRNLLSNAIKFSHRGGDVLVSVEEEDGYAKFTVKDKGVGIKPEHLSLIFEFGMVKTNWGTEDEKGSGFGLPICMEFVTRNGGKIYAESVLDEETKIIFTLPLDK